MRIIRQLLVLPLAFSVGCADVEGDGHDHHDHHDHEHEVFTTIILNFSTADDPDGVDVVWQDPSAMSDAINDGIALSVDTSYDVNLSFLNEYEEPAEDITPEILDEADEHQVFFTGAGVIGPATGDNADALVEHMYADQDPNGLPLGLSNTVTTLAAGDSEMVITLRHMPLENGSTIKEATTADDVASGGFANIGGANDVQVTFDLTVQ